MSYLDYLNKNYPVRRSAAEKERFARYVLDQVTGRGIAARIETTADGKNNNIIIGDPTTAKVVCTAHYDTPASALFPNLMIPRNKGLYLLCQFIPIILILAVAIGGGLLVASQFSQPGRDDFMAFFLLPYLLIYYGLYILLYRVFKNPNNYNDNTSGVSTVLSLVERLNEEDRANFAFILFDNEEKGKKGSKAYYKDHKNEMKDRFLVNFDCVGNGERIIFIAMKEAEKCGEYEKLRQSFFAANGMATYFYPIKGSESNSDYKNFPCGVGCMACRKSKRGVFYTPYLHTPKDRIADGKNIDFLVDGMSRFAALLK